MLCNDKTSGINPRINSGANNGIAMETKSVHTVRVSKPSRYARRGVKICVRGEGLNEIGVWLGNLERLTINY